MYISHYPQNAQNPSYSVQYVVHAAAFQKDGFVVVLLELLSQLQHFWGYLARLNLRSSVHQSSRGTEEMGARVKSTQLTADAAEQWLSVMH